MGIPFISRKRSNQDPQVTSGDEVAQRFNAYYPRVFAYAQSCAGGEIPAEDIVVRAFCRAYERAGGDEDRFRRVLFRTARGLCRRALKTRQQDRDDPLDQREREMLSLMFDARLTRAQIADMFRIRGATVSAALMSGLRKLKDQACARPPSTRHQPA